MPLVQPCDAPLFLFTSPAPSSDPPLPNRGDDRSASRMSTQVIAIENNTDDDEDVILLDEDIPSALPSMARRFPSTQKTGADSQRSLFLGGATLADSVDLDLVKSDDSDINVLLSITKSPTSPDASSATVIETRTLPRPPSKILRDDVSLDSDFNLDSEAPSNVQQILNCISNLDSMSKAKHSSPAVHSSSQPLPATRPFSAADIPSSPRLMIPRVAPSHLELSSPPRPTRLPSSFSNYPDLDIADLTSDDTIKPLGSLSCNKLTEIRSSSQSLPTARRTFTNDISSLPHRNRLSLYPSARSSPPPPARLPASFSKYGDLEIADLIDSSSSPLAPSADRGTGSKQAFGGGTASLTTRKHDDLVPQRTDSVLEQLDLNINASGSSASSLPCVDALPATKKKKTSNASPAARTAGIAVARRAVSERENAVSATTASRVRKANKPDEAAMAPKRARNGNSKAEEAKAARAVVRAEKQQQKEIAAREKERDKELLAINRLKINKRDICAEMIVDIDEDFSTTTGGQHMQTLLKELGIEVSTTWRSPTGNMIKFRRKVKAEFNVALSHFVPIPEEVRKENIIIVVFTAVEFIDMIMLQKLDDSTTSIRSLFPGMQILFMIEGLNNMQRKLALQTRREFSNMVHNSLNYNSNDATTTTKQRRSKVQDELLLRVQSTYNHAVHADMIEMAKVSLLVKHGVHAFHTTTALDSASWLAVLAQDIGTIPYRYARLDIFETICMDAGQIPSGKDNKGMFMEAFSQIKGITPSMASSMYNKFKSLNNVMEDVDKYGKKAFLALESDREMTIESMTGGAKRRIGERMATQLQFLFSTTDPNAEVP
ncbi:uncharacterized protein V1518DRAFT_410868 [Limtongia smithiae]|uniref:uncharacterized protein n=1 Tax=Limtongia smithiae TaxID=1125753 RepID=UPI0034CF122B